MIKNEEAVRIEQFRPIYPLNVSFKISTKVGTKRLTWIAYYVVKLTQTAFMPGRYILEDVVVLHELYMKVNSRNLTKSSSKWILIRLAAASIADEWFRYCLEELG